MSDLANALKMLANSISGGTTESVGNSGDSNSAVSNEEVSVFERKTNENVDFDYSSMDDEEFFWWQERLEEKSFASSTEQIVSSNSIELSSSSSFSSSKFDSATLDKKEWSTISPTENTGWCSGSGYSYTTSKGVVIKVEDTSGVQIYENKETGEVIVVGAKDADITTGDTDVNLSIYDSNIDSIKTGNGNDNITITNSNVASVNAQKGSDNLTLNNSKIEYLDTGNGEDEVSALNNSFIEALYTGKGNDAVLLENSELYYADLGDNEDYFSALNSQFETIHAGNGENNLFIDTSKAGSIFSGNDSDVIVVSNSNVDSIESAKADDIISVSDSKINNLNTGKGNDSVIIQNSTITNIGTDDKDSVRNKDNEVIDNVDQIIASDDETIENAQNITEGKTSLYSDKELSPEEQFQALSIDYFASNLETMKENFEKQESEDGLLRDGFNLVKEWMDLGVSKEDIQAAIKEQEQMVAELTAALNGESEESFETVFKRWTGIEYSQENLTKYMETANLYNTYVGGMEKIEDFYKNIKDSTNMEEVFEAYVSMYGDKETARKEMNAYIEKMQNESGDETIAYLDENYSFVIHTPGTDPNKYPLDEIQNWYTADGGYYYSRLDVHKEFTQDFEKMIGAPVSELQEDMVTLQVETFGKGNSFQNLIDRYCREQEGFADAVSSATSTFGLGLMVIGGVVCCFNPPAGISVLKFGQYTAMAGMFSDNAIDLVDELSSENGLSKEEGWNLMKETIKEVALLYSGMKINGVANGAKGITLTATQNKALAFMAEIGTDASLSLLTDLMITGDIDFTGEGISQLIGIITGIAGAKVNDYTNKIMTEADVLFKQNSDLDATLRFLESKKIPKKQIEIYKKGAIDKALTNGLIKVEDLNATKKFIMNTADPYSTMSKLIDLQKNNVDINKLIELQNKGANIEKLLYMGEPSVKRALELKAQGKTVSVDKNGYFYLNDKGNKVYETSFTNKNNSFTYEIEVDANNNISVKKFVNGKPAECKQNELQQISDIHKYGLISDFSKIKDSGINISNLLKKLNLIDSSKINDLRFDEVMKYWDIANSKVFDKLTKIISPTDIIKHIRTAGASECSLVNVNMIESSIAQKMLKHVLDFDTGKKGEIQGCHKAEFYKALFKPNTDIKALLDSYNFKNVESAEFTKSSDGKSGILKYVVNGKTNLIEIKIGTVDGSLTQYEYNVLDPSDTSKIIAKGKKTVVSETELNEVYNIITTKNYKAYSQISDDGIVQYFKYNGNYYVCVPTAETPSFFPVTKQYLNENNIDIKNVPSIN